MIRFILKGLLRDPSRSRLPVMMVATGACLTVFLYSWMQGVLGDLVDFTARFDTGHAKVVTRAYAKMADQVPNDLALLGVNALLGELRAAHRDMVWTPRTRFGGILDLPDDQGETSAQGPVSGLGVDLLGPESPEPEILNLRQALVRGRLPRAADEVLVSDDFARKLGVEPGGKATLLGSTMHGAMAMHNFRVVGTVRFGVTALDRGALIADIRDVQQALDMEDGAGEILGFSADKMYPDERMQRLSADYNAALAGKDDEFLPVMRCLRDQNGLAEMLDLAAMAGSIIVGVFALAMAIVLWNAALMNGLRRYGEVGLRLAMGEPKGALFRWMLAESLVIGAVGSVLGTLLGLGVSYYFQIQGLDMGSSMRESSMMMSTRMRAHVTGVSYVLGFLPGLVAPFLGTVLAGIGLYRRQTCQLFKELEV